MIPRPPLPGDANDHPEWGAGTGSTVGQYTVASLPVAGYSTEDYSLASVMNQLPLPLPFCSIRIQYSGAPGSMEAQVSSVEQNQDLIVDAKAENEGNGWAGSGANPWHLDKHTESVLFLTNESDQKAHIGFAVTANGVRYYLTELVLQPHETRAIDMRQLRDTQLADFKKNKIPGAATDGSVEWVRLDDVPVEGRLMVIERGGAVAASYDCNPSNCPADTVLLELAADPLGVIPGGGAQLTVECELKSCNGSPYYEQWSPSGCAWRSTNTSVATVDSSGWADGVNDGAASFAASGTGNAYECSNHCTATHPTVSGSTAVNVCGNYGCNDARDCVIQQYYSYPTVSPSFVPGCTDFSNNAGTTNFTFGELNVNQAYAWAILRSYFLAGLQDTRTLYAQAMSVNSGYREPAYNHSIGGAQSSRHVFGDAADIASNSTTWHSLTTRMWRMRASSL